MQPVAAFRWETTLQAMLSTNGNMLRDLRLMSEGFVAAMPECDYSEFESFVARDGSVVRGYLIHGFYDRCVSAIFFVSVIPAEMKVCDLCGHSKRGNTHTKSPNVDDIAYCHLCQGACIH